MPIIGEIRRDCDVGFGKKHEKVIWVACPDCGKERWITVVDTRKSTFTSLCKRCCLIKRNGKLENSPNWKGGIKHVNGYVLVYLKPHHRFRSMTDSLGYVKRSRLVMAEYLGRPLSSKEEVHHEDENRANDNLSNLYLFSTKRDHQFYHRNKEIDRIGIRPIDKLGQFLKGGYCAY